MKHSLTLLLAIAALGWLIPHGGPSWTQAQTTNVAATARFKVIDMNKISITGGNTAAEALEAVLNDMAAQGWRFAAISGTLLILTSN